MQCEGAGHNEHCGSVNVLEGLVADKLRLDDGAVVCNVCVEMMHVADGCAGCDGCLDFAEVFFGFAEELFCFTVIGRGFAFLRKGLGVGEKVEVAEELLAFTGEVD